MSLPGKPGNALIGRHRSSNAAPNPLKHRNSARNHGIAGPANPVFAGVQLGEVVASQKREGKLLSPDLLAHVSPLGWEHINLTGEYRWPKP
nr:Tn3 family transposase [Aminobacter niigataensis]